MRKQVSYQWIVLIVLVAFGFSGCTSSQIKDVEEADAKPAEFEQVVELEKAVHFQTPAGEAVVISPGAYSVEAADGALRLIPSSEEEGQPVTVQAEATTHEEAVEKPESMAMPGEEDQHVVMLLMPNGKALEASGSYSGVSTRGKKKFRFNFKGLKGILKYIPKISGVFTTPRFGAISPNGTIYIKGKQFGKKKGTIVLTVKKYGGKGRWSTKKYNLTVKQWGDKKIKATIPKSIVGVADGKVSFVLKTAKRIPHKAWKVNFYATRETKQLRRGEAMKLGFCSNGADVNWCLGLNFSDKGSCFYKNKERKDASISAFHLNCDDVVDWDDGSDVYEVRLKNGWVFDKIDPSGGGSSAKDWVKMPVGRALKKLKGLSVWKPTIKWKISPGKDYVAYHYWIKVKGPKGVPTK